MACCFAYCRDSVDSCCNNLIILSPKFPDTLIQRVFFVMQVYLTNFWRISFTRAAAIMNFWEGMSHIFPPLLQLLADTVVGNFWIALISTIFSTLGIGMVAISVPGIPDENKGRCRLPGEESCLNDTQKGLFFTDMVLIAIGRAGISFSLDALHDALQRNRDHESCVCLRKLLRIAFGKCVEAGVWIERNFIYLIGSLLVVIWSKKWKLLFGIPAIYSAYMTVPFLYRLCRNKSEYNSETSPHSPITIGCKVLCAAAMNNRRPLTQDFHHHHPEPEPEPLFDHLPNIYGTRFTRCLDGALYSFDEEEVETTRFVVAMIPISMTFIFCGVVSSIGNTYFVEQANHMNRKIGKWNVPLLALQFPVLVFKMCHDYYLWLFFEAIDKDKLRQRFKIDLPILGIGIAMTYSVLCCITAARMEMKRLKVIRSHHLFEKPDDVMIPMHAAWLLFQFFLLAGLDSSLRKSIEEFYKDHAPRKLKKRLDDDNNAKRYLAAAVEFVSGIGFLSSVLSVYVVGRLSNWFQATLNKSRLDRYYWLLAELSAVNLLVFLFLALGYMRKPNLTPLRGIPIVALVWSDTLMRRAFFVMQPYLTDIWRIGFTHAAAIVNIWEGTSLMLPALFQFIADKYLGNFRVVVMCAISSTLGLGMVTMSLPFDMKKCEEELKNGRDCGIEAKQRALLYIGVALTAIGRGGLSVCVPRLHDEQNESCHNCLCGYLQRYAANIQDLIVFAVATLIISLITSWNFRFGFPAMATAFTTLCFLAGWTLYKKTGPKRNGSLLATFLKVFVAPRTRRNEVDEVALAATPQESSFIRHISGISITFIMLGIVSALGNTFFVEQANHMDRSIGFITLPLAAFQLPMLIATIAAPCCLVTCFFLRCVNDYGRYFCIPQCLRRIPSILGILAAMVHAILCCIVAAAVEKRRHGIWLKAASDAEKEDVKYVVPMHATWLIFQFYLVACVDVFFRNSIEAYYHAQAPTGLRDNYNIYTDFVSGLGYFSSVILVAVAGRISDGGGEAWFVKSVNKSRLDRYYWVLAVLTALSFGAFCVLAPFSICKNVPPPPAQERERERERERRGDDHQGQGRLSSCCFLR